ncbi:MAG: hypothetical protein ACFHXK_14640 [bacterium]
MIIKKITITEQAGVELMQGAEQSCFGCQQGCAGKWFAQEQPQAPATNAAQAVVALSGTGLNAVVAVLFGLPLLLLLGLGATEQLLGLAARPLLSLTVICAALALVAALLVRSGTKLIELLQVEVYNRTRSEHELS